MEATCDLYYYYYYYNIRTIIILRSQRQNYCPSLNRCGSRKRFKEVPCDVHTLKVSQKLWSHSTLTLQGGMIDLRAAATSKAAVGQESLQ